MKSNPKISVIIPVYNCDKYIKRLIESILIQNYTNYEVIILNDGSTDNTKSILDAINNKKFTIINKKNSGVSDSRNIGIEHSTGELLLFLDSDDYINKNYFSTIIKIYNNYQDVDLINFGFYSEVEDKNLNVISSDKINYKTILLKNKNMIKKNFVDLWDNTMLYNVWNKVYITEIIKKNNIRFYDKNWGEDVQFNREYLLLTNKLYNSNSCFYHYIRERQGAQTKKYNPDLFNIRKKEFYEFNEYFEKYHIIKEEYYEFSCRRYIERVLGCIENVYNGNLKIKSRYLQLKNIINDPLTIEAIKHVKPNSKKIKIMIIPIKLKLVILTMVMGKSFNIMKNKFPGLFNKMKNRR